MTIHAFYSFAKIPDGSYIFEKIIKNYIKKILQERGVTGWTWEYSSIVDGRSSVRWTAKSPWYFTIPINPDRHLRRGELAAVLVQVAADGHAPMPRGRTVRTRGRRRPARGNRVGYFCPGVAIVEPVVRSGSTSEWDATPLPHQQAATTTTWNLALHFALSLADRRGLCPLARLRSITLELDLGWLPPATSIPWRWCCRPSWFSGGCTCNTT